MTDNRPTESKTRAQYEAHSYPPNRDTDAAADMALGCLDSLARMNHYLWNGEATFDDGFRVLVAGGGTGDATVRLARQLSHLGNTFEIVHLDLSTASMAIAKKRLARYGLEHTVTFVQGSLLDLPTMHLGTFNYINCSGVLHHLDSPRNGLAALVSVLAPDGGLGLMLYGELGRTGIYDIQEIMRKIGAGLPDGSRIDLARRLLAKLPPTNRLATSPLGYGGDPAQLPDADIVDLFLHPCDRPYRVPEVLDLLSRAGVSLTAFVPGWIYRPDWLVDDPLVKSRTSFLPPDEAAQVAELLGGAIPTHTFFAGHQGPSTVAKEFDDNTILIPDRLSLAQAIDGAGTTLAFAAMERPVALPRLTKTILEAMDGQRTVGEIRTAIGAGVNFDGDLRTLAEVLCAADLMWVSRKLTASYVDPTSPPMLCQPA